jgi:hypothetical protein
MLYLIIHQPPAAAAFGEALQERYTAHAVQASTWILEAPIPSAHDLLAELTRIGPLDQNAERDRDLLRIHPSPPHRSR